MAFDTIERSASGGRPIHLFKLARGGVVVRYNDSDETIEREGFSYQPLPIRRGEISDSTERRKNMVTLTMPVDAEVASWWRPYPPSGPVFVTCMATHYSDTEVATEWTGKVIGPKFSDTELQLSCEPSSASNQGRGRTLRWQRGCPLALYSQGIGMCNVSKATHAIPAEPSAIVGVTVTAAAFDAVPDGRLAGGFMEYLRTDGEMEFRTIMAHTGANIVLNYGLVLPPGAEVVVYPGCAHTWADCGYFDNQDNYGGSLFMPNKSPFDGNPV